MKDINDLSQLALKSLEEKNLPPTPENYEREFHYLSEKKGLLLEEKFIYDEIIESLCKTEKNDFNKYPLKSFRRLSTILVKRISQHKIKQFLVDLSYFMSPSLSKDLKDEIDSLCADISNNPYDLINVEVTRKLRRLTEKRILDDKSLFNEKNEDVKKLIRFLASLFKKTVDKNNITIEKITDIKDEINSLGLSKSSTKHIEVLQKKLLEAVEKFEETLIENNLSIYESQHETEVLYNQIEKLKLNLDKAEKEKSIDFLTGVLTRRAYSLEVERIENEYNVFDSNYALIFYDIDHFKLINDTYGHDCGDSILSTFSSILKKLTRTEDIICRYGGEEFICIVHYKNRMEIENYLNRVKNIIHNNKFVYKKNKIEVKAFSAGVAFRNNHNSYEETLRNADKYLYIAKDNGRDRIIFDNGDVF